MILSSQVCPQCGWKRPLKGEVGKFFWPPIEFNTPIGGVSRTSPTSFVSYYDLLVLSTQNNELASIFLEKGEIKWRVALPKGQRSTDFTLHKDTIYVTVQDTHSLVEGIAGGFIAKVNLENGDIQPVWSTASHDLTPPLFNDNHIFVRTAESKVLCLNDFGDKKPVWERSCQSWWPAPINCFGSYLIYLDGNPMFDETEVIALEKTTGEVAWVTTIPTRPSQRLIGDDSFLFIIINNKIITKLDVKTGQQINKLELPRIYCQPVLAGKTLYYVAKGSITDAYGYYQLQAVDIEDLTFRFKKRLGTKVLIPPVVVDDTLYYANDETAIHAISTTDGKDIWSLTNSMEDVILTTLHYANNKLLYGTYLGKVFSINVSEPAETLGKVKEFLEKEDYESAASIYALDGKYDKAAKLYIDQVGDVDKAMCLLEAGNHWKMAAELAFENKLYSKALELYRGSNDVIGEANTLLAMGDIEEAAKLFYSQEELVKAAQLFEKSGKLNTAATIYKEAGRMVDFVRLITKTVIVPSEVESLRKEGNFETAAQWEMENRDYLEAAKDYRQTGLLEKELDAYKKHLEQAGSAPEQWIWQRVAELGTKLSDYLVAANAWKKLEQWGKAGMAYQSYAMQLAERISDSQIGFTTDEHLEVANYFQLAADAFKEEGVEKRENECAEMVRKYKHLPKVVVLVVQTTTGLREMEWNNLSLTIKNIGYGRAREIQFRINEDRFEVEVDSMTRGFNLAPGLTLTQQFHIKPNRDEYGSVPLQLKWSWKDHNGEESRDGGSISVTVARQREELPSQPIYINFQTINGDLVTHKGDNISTSTTIGGETQRTSPISVSLDAITSREDHDASSRDFEKPIKYCTTCQKPISFIAKFCPFCQTEQPMPPT